MQSNYHIVQLVNGLNLVGDLEYTPDCVMLKFPLEVSAKSIKNEEGKIIGEQMVLRPFLVMTDDREITIDQFNVICTSTLSERLYRSYEEMVENVYGKPVSFEGDFYTEEDTAKEIEDLSEEERQKMQEQLNDIIDSMDDTNKVLH
jgi:hypothetical protein